MKLYRRSALALVCSALASTTFAQHHLDGHSQHEVKLREVAAFEHQVTGITVSADGRKFVSFPRWTEDAPLSVAEITSDGDLRPYPDAQWNAWRNAKRDQITPQDHWVCVQSVVADTRGNLWVIDPGAPAQAVIVPGAPKQQIR